MVNKQRDEYTYTAYLNTHQLDFYVYYCGYLVAFDRYKQSINNYTPLSRFSWLDRKKHLLIVTLLCEVNLKRKKNLKENKNPT